MWGRRLYIGTTEAFHLGGHLPTALGGMARSEESADVTAGISFHRQVSKAWKVQRAEISVLPWAGRKLIDAGKAGVQNLQGHI